MSESGFRPQYVVAPGRQAGVASHLQSPPIPSVHGITRVHLMSIDPHSLYGYWELTEEFREMVARHFDCRWDQLPLVIRLYSANDAGDNLNIAREIDVTHLTDNWFFSDLESGRNYVLDLGTKNVYNVYVALLRSNYVTTPRNWPGKSAKSLDHLKDWLPEAISTSYHRLM